VRPTTRFSLARSPQSITLGEAVRALEARHALVECFRDDGGSRVLTPRCRLKTRLAAAREAFMRELDTTTLAECAYPARPRERASRQSARGPHERWL
jgi:Rrf2 family nitric oxide-sensitive transcriptional repressor